MELLITLLKGVGLALVCLLIAVWLLIQAFKWWLKRKVGQAMAMAEAMPNMTPARVHLEQKDEPWHHPDDVQALSRQFERLGFAPLGDYAVDGMPDMLLRGLAHPAQQLVALVYDHPKAGALFDVMCKYPDQSVAFATNAPTPPFVEIPEDQAWRDPGLTPETATARVLAERRPGQFLTWQADNFVAEFEASYARWMDRFLQKGEIDAETLRQAPKSLGDRTVYTDKQIEITRQFLHGHQRSQIEAACLDNYLKTSTLTAAQWEAVRERAVVLHERMAPDDVVDALQSLRVSLQEDDMQETLQRLSQGERDVFLLAERINALLPASKQFLSLGTLTQPVNAQVWVAPR